MAGANNKKLLLFITLLFAAFELSAQKNDSISHLTKQGTATQLIVDGRPMLILGGELGNSRGASLRDMDWICPKMEALGLNTILVPAYWDMIEPVEGQFDFTLVDGIIDRAREHNLKVVFLWFGVWKNSMSCYAPVWVKQDWERFPRTRKKDGTPIEIMTPFSDNNLQADIKVFRRLMRHIKEYDGERNTVIMVQVENEIGMIPEARDYHPEAEKAFNAPVPKELTDYMKSHKSSLRPALAERWRAAGSKTSGTWNEIFGESLYTDEIFMAYHYGKFIEEVTRAGKEEYALPMYVNAALNSRGREPGAYPSAGPLAHLLDVWRASAPSLDFIAPDIYDPGFADWAAQYHVDGNPLFIPEMFDVEENGARVFYVFGQHDAMGFCPFAIENTPQIEDSPLWEAYRVLRQLSPLLAEKQGYGMTNGVLFDNDHREKTIERNGYRFHFKHDYTLGWTAAAKDGSDWPETGALLIELGPDEYIIAGTGVVVTFANAGKKGLVTGIGSIDEVEFEDGKIVYSKRLNGDENHQGRHLRIPAGQWGIQYLKLYNFK